MELKGSPIEKKTPEVNSAVLRLASMEATVAHLISTARRLAENLDGEMSGEEIAKGPLSVSGLAANLHSRIDVLDSMLGRLDDMLRRVDESLGCIEADHVG